MLPPTVSLECGIYILELRIILFVIASALTASILYGLVFEKQPVTWERLGYLCLILPFAYTNVHSPFHTEFFIPIATVYGSHHLLKLLGTTGIPFEGIPTHPLKRFWDC